MDCAVHFVAAERRNDAFDLPPMTKSDDITLVAAALGPHGRLEAGIIAIAFDEVRCVCERHAAVDE